VQPIEVAVDGLRAAIRPARGSRAKSLDEEVHLQPERTRNRSQIGTAPATRTDRRSGEYEEDQRDPDLRERTWEPFCDALHACDGSAGGSSGNPSAGRLRGHLGQAGHAPEDRNRQQLYEIAKDLDIRGRSKMGGWGSRSRRFAS